MITFIGEYPNYASDGNCSLEVSCTNTNVCHYVSQVCAGWTDDSGEVVHVNRGSEFGMNKRYRPYKGED